MHTISSTWPELLGQFFQVFTKPDAEIVLSLMTGWVLCTTRRTVTGILPFEALIKVRKFNKTLSRKDNCYQVYVLFLNHAI